MGCSFTGGHDARIHRTSSPVRPCSGRLCRERSNGADCQRHAVPGRDLHRTGVRRRTRRSTIRAATADSGLVPGDVCRPPVVAPPIVRHVSIGTCQLSHLGRVSLRVRSLEGADDRVVVLAGTDGASSPFFSPDGQWIGYVEGAPAGSLKKVSFDGGKLESQHVVEIQ